MITKASATEIEENLPSLKEVYKDYFKMGAAVTANELTPQAKELIKKHFNSLTAGNEMKPESLLDYNKTVSYMNQTGDQTLPQISLKSAQSIIEFAIENDIEMRGHVLIWHSQTPRWLFA